MDFYNVLFNTDNEGNKLSTQRLKHKNFVTLKDGRVVFLGGPGQGGGSDSSVVAGISKDKLLIQINEWQQTDRRKIAMDAISETGAEGVNTIILSEAQEVLGIATITNEGELLNLATKRSGYGTQMMEEIARQAIRDNTIVWGTSSDDAIGFYARLGFEIEGFPGENLGVPIYWPKQNMLSFMGEDRGRMMAAASAEYQEFLAYIAEVE